MIRFDICELREEVENFAYEIDVWERGIGLIVNEDTYGARAVLINFQRTEILRSGNYASLSYMSHVRCPLCGKDSAISTFNPEDLDRDIYVRQTSGLGYPGGFTYGPDESVLGDDVYTPKVMDRCIDLLNLFMENGIVTARELAVKLRIGVPLQGTDEVFPYEDILDNYYKQNEALKNQVSSLKNQLSTTRSGVSIFKFEELKTSYNKLANDLEIKRKIEKILKYLYNVLDSKIVLEEDDWVLEVYEYDVVIFPYLCKKLYTLNRRERDMLENRVYTECFVIKWIFRFFKKEPTIRSVFDRLNKKPKKLYYKLHNLPIPDYCKDEGFETYRGINWETLFK